MEKRHTTPAEFYLQSVELGIEVLTSGYLPSFIVPLWKGGAVPGQGVISLCEKLGIDDFYKANGKRFNHFPLRAKRYNKDGTEMPNLEITGLDAIHLMPYDKVLIVDEVWDKGRTPVGVRRALRRNYFLQNPVDATLAKHGLPYQAPTIKIAVITYKLDKTKVPETPDFCLELTNPSPWITYPGEDDGIVFTELEARIESIRGKVEEAMRRSV